MIGPWAATLLRDVVEGLILRPRSPTECGQRSLEAMRLQSRRCFAIFCLHPDHVSTLFPCMALEKVPGSSNPPGSNVVT